jgi:D-threo-aldose 1-dehydrogenase
MRCVLPCASLSGVIQTSYSEGSVKASKTAKNRELFPFSPSPNDVIFDYTASGVRRSIEDSLQRLGIDSLDIVFVHDISSDNNLLPTSWQEQFDIAKKGAFPS